MAHPYKEANHVELIRAYAHPCFAWDSWFPVDSNFEHQTLDVLMNCRDWLHKNHQLSTTINKPLFDIGPDAEYDSTTHKICKPDFVINVHSDSAMHPVIVAETMGYSTEDYRARKERMLSLFSSINNQADVPVIEHDFCLKGVDSKERDSQFFRKVAGTALKKKKGV